MLGFDFSGEREFSRACGSAIDESFRAEDVSEINGGAEDPAGRFIRRCEGRRYGKEFAVHAGLRDPESSAMVSDNVWPDGGSAIRG
jgi:hypothetical protein